MVRAQEDHEPEAQGDYWLFVDKAIERISTRIPSIDPDAMRLVMSLHRAARLIAYDTQSVLTASTNVSRAAMRVLLVLAVEHPIEMRMLVKLTGMSRAATSAITQRMEADGMVSRSPSEKDGRSVLIELTAEGERIFDQSFLKYNEREKFWKDSIPPSDAQNLLHALNRLMSTKLH